MGQSLEHTLVVVAFAAALSGCGRQTSMSGGPSVSPLQSGAGAASRKNFEKEGERSPATGTKIETASAPVPAESEETTDMPVDVHGTTATLKDAAAAVGSDSPSVLRTMESSRAAAAVPVYVVSEEPRTNLPKTSSRQTSAEKAAVVPVPAPAAAPVLAPPEAADTSPEASAAPASVAAPALVAAPAPPLAETAREEACPSLVTIYRKVRNGPLEGVPSFRLRHLNTTNAGEAAEYGWQLEGAQSKFQILQASASGAAPLRRCFSNDAWQLNHLTTAACGAGHLDMGVLGYVYTNKPEDDCYATAPLLGYVHRGDNPDTVVTLDGTKEEFSPFLGYGWDYSGSFGYAVSSEP